MSLITVAEKEFLDTVRSNALLVSTLAFVLWAGFLAAIQHVPNIHEGSYLPRSTLALMNSMQQSAVFFVPLIGLGLGYNAIAGERERGSLKFMLGLPHTRLDIVVGKFLGRTAVIWVAILSGYTTAAAVAILTYDSFALGIFVRYTLLTLLYGSVYVAIGVGFSAFVKSRSMAFGAATVLFVVFLLLWDAFLLFLQLVAVGWELPENGLPEWIQFVGVLNPSTAVEYASRALVPEFHELTVFNESDALYLQNWVGLVVLGLWLVGPLAIGYARFRRTDLH
ncbi:ABC transporter permease [Natronorubrum texcoconense]|uniref:ABC-2 type transport system permease protein n=1 Tax=Natronorubrum texcoconense TaxID=1095776 RepID=A0A1G8UUY7_9EURY|nr:ABC transporter permease [Natronorubrum texcoconense]SDJ57611.1 ABC-2 type transport system permease protein [Natronorubrum texcoconense]